MSRQESLEKEVIGHKARIRTPSDSGVPTKPEIELRSSPIPAQTSTPGEAPPPAYTSTIAETSSFAAQSAPPPQNLDVSGTYVFSFDKSF